MPVEPKLARPSFQPTALRYLKSSEGNCRPTTIGRNFWSLRAVPVLPTPVVSRRTWWTAPGKGKVWPALVVSALPSCQRRTIPRMSSFPGNGTRPDTSVDPTGPVGPRPRPGRPYSG